MIPKSKIYVIFDSGFGKKQTHGRTRMCSSSFSSDNRKSKIQNRKWVVFSVIVFVVLAGASAQAQQQQSQPGNPPQAQTSPAPSPNQDQRVAPAAPDRAGEAPQRRATWQDDVAIRADRRLAAFKDALRLTPDQEKNWPAFESGIRELVRLHLERMSASPDRP